MPTENGSVGLTIDYSNGTRKTFQGIAWSPGMRILGAMDAAKSMRPGLAYEPLMTRGWAIILTEIDGIKARDEGSSAQWLAWVNERFLGRTVDADEGMPTEDRQRILEAATLQPGDTVLLKLSTGPDQP